MTKSKEREEILRELRREANGSFSAVYRALIQESNDKGSSSIQKNDVKNRIKNIIEERNLQKTG